MYFTANQVFAAELCCPQGIRCSLPNNVFRSESGFAVEVMLSAANLRSLPKLCCLQRKCDSLPKLSFLQRISIRCQKRVGCSEVAFAVEIVVPAAKQFSLPNYTAGSEPVFAAELYSLQRISFRC